jgi:hypothetical protein
MTLLMELHINQWGGERLSGYHAQITPRQLGMQISESLQAQDKQCELKTSFRRQRSAEPRQLALTVTKSKS